MTINAADKLPQLAGAKGGGPWYHLLGIISEDGFVLTGISKRVLALTATALLAAAPANADTRHWDVKQREQSQALSSSAMNFLRNRHPGNSDGNANLQAAIKLLEKACRTDASDPLPHYLLGIALAIDGRYEQALASLKVAHTLERKEQEILIATGLAQYLSGNYEKAISVWGKQVEQAKIESPVHACLGFAHMRMGDFDEARKHFRAAKGSTHSAQLAAHGQGITEYLAGDLPAAREALNEALSHGPYAPVTLLLARIDFLEGDEAAGEKLLADYNKQLKSAGQRSMTSLGFISQHDFHWDPFNEDNFDSPVAVRFAHASPKKKLPSMKQSTPKNKRGSPDEKPAIDKNNLPVAIAELEKRLNHHESDFYLNYQLGLIQLASRDYKQAAEELKNTYKTCTSCQVALLDLAYAFSKIDDGKNATSTLEAYMKKYPDQKLADSFKTIATTSGAQQADPSNSSQ